MTIRRIRVRGCKSVEVECKIEPVGNDADKVFDNCPERESDFESKMLEFLQSCRRVEEMLQHMISSAKKHDNQDEYPKLEIEGGNDVSIKEEKILYIDTVQVLDEIPEEETEVWKEVHVFDENHEMEETEQLNEDEEETLEWEGTHDLICRDYMNQSLHIDGVEDGNSVLEHLETSEAQMFGKLSTWAPPQAMFNTISLSDFELSMPLTLELIVNYGGKLKVIDVLDCTGSAEFIASTLGKVEVESYTWVSSSLAVSSSWKDPIPGSCVKSSGIAVVIKCTSLAFILGVKEIIYCCDKMNATNSNYSKAWGIDRVQGELGKVINCYGGQTPTRILFVDFSKTRPPKVTDYFEEMVNMKADQDTGQGTNVMKRPFVFLGMVAQNLSLLMHAPLWKPENEDMTNLLIEGGSIPMVHVLDALKLYLPLVYTKHFTRTLSYWIFLLELHYVVNSSIVGGLSATGTKLNSLEDILFAYTKSEISFLWHPLYQSPKIFLSQGPDNIESSLL